MGQIVGGMTWGRAMPCRIEKMRRDSMERLFYRAATKKRRDGMERLFYRAATKKRRDGTERVVLPSRDQRERP
jgi:hypothetical protein